jgi:serine/threonine protein kinase
LIESSLIFKNIKDISSGKYFMKDCNYNNLEVSLCCNYFRKWIEFSIDLETFYDVFCRIRVLQKLNPSETNTKMYVKHNDNTSTLYYETESISNLVSLDILLKDNKFTFKLAKEITFQLLSIFKFLNDTNISLLNIKEENILVNKPQREDLLDIRIGILNLRKSTYSDKVGREKTISCFENDYIPDEFRGLYKESLPDYNIKLIDGYAIGRVVELMSRACGFSEKEINPLKLTYKNLISADLAKRENIMKIIFNDIDEIMKSIEQMK